MAATSASGAPPPRVVPDAKAAELSKMRLHRSRQSSAYHEISGEIMSHSFVQFKVQQRNTRFGVGSSTRHLKLDLFTQIVSVAKSPKDWGRGKTYHCTDFTKMQKIRGSELDVMVQVESAEAQERRSKRYMFASQIQRDEFVRYIRAVNKWSFLPGLFVDFSSDGGMGVASVLAICRRLHLRVDEATMQREFAAAGNTTLEYREFFDLFDGMLSQDEKRPPSATSKPSSSAGATEPDNMAEGERVITMANNSSLRLLHRQFGTLSRVSSHGRLYVTNFRIVFTPFASIHASEAGVDDSMAAAEVGPTELPLMTVSSVQLAENASTIVLQGKDLRTIAVAFDGSPTLVKEVLAFIRRLITVRFDHGLRDDLFAVEHRTALGLSLDPKDNAAAGWDLYNIEREFRRQLALDTAAAGAEPRGKAPPSPRAAKGSVRKHRAWTQDSATFTADWLRLVDNGTFELSPTYPAQLLLPVESLFKQHELNVVCGFRSKARIPSVTWYSKHSKRVLARSSMPLVGPIGRHSKEDEKLIDVYRRHGKSTARAKAAASKKQEWHFAIVDARPLLNSNATRFKPGGGGCESASRYTKASLEHMGIENIHAMRSSLIALAKLCQPGAVEDDETGWHSKLEETLWLKHVRMTLTASVKVAHHLEVKRESVLVHCSDGWDRTAQLCALAQLLVDPYYRTMEGLGVLIEKDWCSFGHKFQDRYGHGMQRSPGKAEGMPFFVSGEASPIFVQFLDCTWQIMRQFPTAFEYTTQLLIELADAVCSCQFGNFLYNNEKDRARFKVRDKTVSFWMYVMRNKERFASSCYVPSEKVLWPCCSPKRIALWEAYYSRFDPDMASDRHGYNVAVPAGHAMPSSAAGAGAAVTPAAASGRESS